MPNAQYNSGKLMGDFMSPFSYGIAVSFNNMSDPCMKCSQDGAHVFSGCLTLP